MVSCRVARGTNHRRASARLGSKKSGIYRPQNAAHPSPIPADAEIIVNASLLFEWTRRVLTRGQLDRQPVPGAAPRLQQAAQSDRTRHQDPIDAESECHRSAEGSRAPGDNGSETDRDEDYVRNSHPCFAARGAAHFDFEESTFDGDNFTFRFISNSMRAGTRTLNGTPRTRVEK